MPTKNPRINITMAPEITALLTDLAKQEKKSVSGLAQDLILEALDRREDRALSRIAELRDVDGATRVSHAKAWK